MRFLSSLSFRFFMILLLSIITIHVVGAKSLWRERNLFSSADNIKNGDIIVVMINDISNMTFSLSLKNKNSASVTSEPDINITGFLPKVNGSKNISGDDKVELAGKGKLVLAIPASVTNVQQNGNLVIGGRKELVFNGVSTSFTVSGIVEPSMLKGKAIDSNQVLNFRLAIAGTKQGSGLNINRAAPAEGESANSTLTEAEKQRLIIDYLNKMIDELNR